MDKRIAVTNKLVAVNVNVVALTKNTENYRQRAATWRPVQVIVIQLTKKQKVPKF
jgi:hypothetical protein